MKATNMKRLVYCFLFCTLLLNACASPVYSKPFISSAGTAASKTAVPTNTSLPTNTPTPRLSAIIKNETDLYSGPGNVDYEILANIPAGEQVYLLGIFNDFVKIQYHDQTGYVVKTAFDQLPAQLSELSDNSLPLQSINLLKYIYDPGTSFSSGVATIDCIDNSQSCGEYNYGPIAISKAFSIEINMLQVGSYGAIVLSGQTPGPGNQFWGNRLILYIAADSQIILGVGQSSPIYRQNIDGILEQPFSVIFPDSQGKSMIIESQSGKELAKIDLTTVSGVNFPEGLFPDRELYFGTSVGPSSSLTIGRFDLTFSPDGSFQELPITLRTLADHEQTLIGANIGLWDTSDLMHQNIVKTEFNGATIGFSWADIEPERGTFDFSQTDPLVRFAGDNNMKITGLHLLWGDREHLPDWLLNGNFTAEELKQILQEYISTVANHYKGKIYIWSIANEYTNRVINGGDFWNVKLGPQYVEMAFNWAHEADPSALLMLNEDGNKSMLGTNAQVVTDMLSFIEQWKGDNVPINAIGMQMHLLSPFSNQTVPTKQEVIATMQKFFNLGYPVYVTEFDLNLHNVQGTEQEKLDFQAKVYQDMLEACLESGACKGFSIFGISDADSWYNSLNIPDAEPLLFDKDYHPKPAYYSLLEVLKNRTP
jgi:endo-1,4-beta-xylanase